ncbi:hypothetical protein ACH5RR_002736 [Cinchona calisaya]|uniref:Alkyl transferase n=1 Tax=Cinchona calisaya TaxID=153742 RepID=A0ABD3ASW9_9GENT
MLPLRLAKPSPLPINPLFPLKQHKISRSIAPRKIFGIKLHSHSKTPKLPKSNPDDDVIEGRELEIRGLLPDLMPKHIAVIADGNRRWASERGLRGKQGHRAGRRAMKEVVLLCNLCSELGLKALTFFLFSTENWFRPKDQVDFLMAEFEDMMVSDVEEKGIRTSVLGDTSRLPKSLQKAITVAEETSKGNTGLHLMISLNYSGKHDILQATKKIASKVKDGMIFLEDINESLFLEELNTKCTEFPNPDLLIRTGGERRVSNFMLWQLAYTELFFVEKYFPDFKEADILEILRSFQQRHRNYGK